VTTSSPITAIWSCQRVELGTGKMPAACATMPASAKDPYLVNKVCFFHNES
jgi:hypothetical protein